MSETPRRVPRRSLLILVGAVAVFVATLPWQKRQWEATARLRQETQAQEAQIAALKAGAAPTTSGSPLDAAEQLLQAGKTKDAAAVLTEVETRLRADAPTEAALRLSDLFGRAGRIDRAYHWSRVALQKSPDGLEELSRAGSLDLLIGHADPARARFLRAQKLYPDRPEPMIAFALFLNQTGDSARTDELLRSAIKLQPENWQARLLLIERLIESNQFDEARKEAEPLLNEPQARASAWLYIADLRLRQARQPATRDVGVKKATEALDAAAQAGVNPAAVAFRRGQIRLQQDDVPGARRAWEPILTESPDYPGLKFALGRVLVQTGDRVRGAELLKAQQTEKATQDEYDRLVLAAGATPQTADAHRRFARWCQAHGRDARARLEWEFVRKLAPNDPEAMRALKALEAAA